LTVVVVDAEQGHFGKFINQILYQGIK